MRNKKTIEDQGEKQIKAIQDNKKQLTTINGDYKNKLLFPKEREIFKNIYNERLDKIEELHQKIDDNNLKCTVINTGEEFDFDKSEDPLEFCDDIRTGKLSLEEAKNLQKDYEDYLKKYEEEVKVKNKKKNVSKHKYFFLMQEIELSSL